MTLQNNKIEIEFVKTMVPRASFDRISYSFVAAYSTYTSLILSHRCDNVICSS